MIKDELRGHLYWIGPRESDIEAIKHLFCGSVTFFGNGGKEGYSEGVCQGNHTINRSIKMDHNDMGDQNLDRFVYETVDSIIKADPDAKFMMYNPNVLRPHTKEATDRELTSEERRAMYLFDRKFYEDHYVCLNRDETMRAMDSKLTFHRMFSDVLDEENLLEVHLVEGKNIDSYNELCRLFEVDPFSGVRFIVQENFASGGIGTHIVERPKHGERLHFSPDDVYLCSILQENSISVNAHLAIFEDGILLLPGSIQIIRENNKRLMYRGADFIAYRQINEAYRSRFEDMCIEIAEVYRKDFIVPGTEGGTPIQSFRGVLGLDAIIHGGRVKMLECNNRFQASTNLLNYALTNAHLPVVQDMGYCAWKDRAEGSHTGFTTICSAIESAIGGLGRLVEKTTEKNGIPYRALELPVQYANFNFVDSGSNIVHAKRVFAIADYYESCLHSADHTGAVTRYKTGAVGCLPSYEDIRNNAHIYRLERDGYNPAYTYKSFAHLFRITFDTNITSVSPEETLRLNENICENDKAWSDRVVEFDPLATKISLLTQGVVFDRGTQTAEMIALNGGWRVATNEAIDLNLKRPIKQFTPVYTEMIVNAPLNIRFTAFSPFSLRASADTGADHGEHRFELYYYQTMISDNVRLFPEDTFANKRTSKGILYSDVAFLSGDRLRVHVTNRCRFKKAKDENGEDMGCRFCNMRPSGEEDYVFDKATVQEIVRAYLNRAKQPENLRKNRFQFDHFLVGGQSPDDMGNSHLPELVETLHELAPTKRIYVMILPPQGEKARKAIYELINKGATEISFNMEVFSDYYAQLHMPGKAAACPRNSYINALNIARFVMNDSETECVRTMFVVGLEPITSLKQGLRLVIDNGIQPMLSVFRPLPNTPLEGALPPTMQELAALYTEIEKWCSEKGIHLGPGCNYCQNNTLSLPY